MIRSLWVFFLITDNGSIGRSLERTRQHFVRVYVSNKKKKKKSDMFVINHYQYYYYYFYFFLFFSFLFKTMTFSTSLFHAHPVLPKVMMKKTRNKREKEMEIAWVTTPLFVRFIVDDAIADRKWKELHIRTNKKNRIDHV